MKGWECPKCGACFAPHIDRCPDCVSVKSVSVPTVHVTPYPWAPPGRYGVVPCGPPTSAPPADTTVVMQETTGSRIGFGSWGTATADCSNVSSGDVVLTPN